MNTDITLQKLNSWFNQYMITWVAYAKSKLKTILITIVL